MQLFTLKYSRAVTPAGTRLPSRKLRRLRRCPLALRFVPRRPVAGTKSVDLRLLPPPPLPDLAFPATGGCALPGIGREAAHTAPTKPPRRMKVPALPLATLIAPVVGSPANTRPAVARARRSRSGSPACSCQSYSATTAHDSWCAEFLPRRNIPDGCSSNAQTMGYVLVLIRFFTGFGSILVAH
jgi:hypothetical protein